MIRSLDSVAVLCFKPITDNSEAKPMPMTISMTTFDTQLKISFIVYNITIQKLVLK